MILLEQQLWAFFFSLKAIRSSSSQLENYTSITHTPHMLQMLIDINTALPDHCC